MTIDKNAELVQGEKVSEPKAKISGRINHKTMELDLLINYEANSENLFGKFATIEYKNLEGVIYNESIGFKKEDGNTFKLQAI